MSKTNKEQPVIIEETQETIIVSDNNSGSTYSPRFSKKTVLVLAIIAIIGLVAFINKGLLVAATVNGAPITRLSVISDLEKTSGKRSLEAMVTKTLILQEAAKEKVTVSQKEVDDEIKKIEDSVVAQGQKFDDVLAMQGITKAQLTEQIKLQKLIEKMLSKGITVTDKEVTDYIASNSATLSKTAKPEELQTQAKEALTQEKMQSEFTPWLEAIRQKAKINYFVNY